MAVTFRSAFDCGNQIWVCPPITIFWEPCPAILPMECHRALGCGHASVANADAKRQPKLWLVARPLSRSLRGLLFLLCLEFRTLGRLYSRRFWKRLRPNMGRLHVSPARSEFGCRQATPILVPFPKAFLARFPTSIIETAIVCSMTFVCLHCNVFDCRDCFLSEVITSYLLLLVSPAHPLRQVTKYGIVCWNRSVRMSSCFF